MAAKPIVAATDGSEGSLRAVDWAAREAVLRDAPLRIVSAAELLPRMIGNHATSEYETVADTIRRYRDEALAAATERATAAAPGLLIDADPVDGPPAHAVTQSGSGALMLVLGSRGLSAFAAMMLGSVSRYAATRASCPVVVVREETRAVHRQVGVGVGDLDHCGVSLDFAFEEAAVRKAGVVAIHAWHTADSDISRAGIAYGAPGIHAVEAEAAAKLEVLLSDWRDKFQGVQASLDVVHGHPGRALAGLSARTDLVVLGRHPAHHGPGTVIHAVLNHAHGPVVTVPSAPPSPD